MSNRSNDQGRAFEYACIVELKDRIEDCRPVVIDEESVGAAKKGLECTVKRRINNAVVCCISFY